MTMPSPFPPVYGRPLWKERTVIQPCAVDLICVVTEEHATVDGPKGPRRVHLLVYGGRVGCFVLSFVCVSK